MDRQFRLPGLPELCIKTAIVHSITYFLMGVFAAAFLNYKDAFARPEFACWMRQIDDPFIMIGPILQPLRGVIFALAFFPLRAILFKEKSGWLVLWWLLVALAILSTFGPAPGSIEGMTYTSIPVWYQIRGWIEVVPQAGLLSALLFYWINRPEKKWLNWAMGVPFVLLNALMLLNIFSRKHA